MRRVGGQEASKGLKGGLDSWGVSVRGSGGFTAFLRRCARRLQGSASRDASITALQASKADAALLAS